MIKKGLVFFGIIILTLAAYFAVNIYQRLYPSPNISDSPTSIIGFNHVGISVTNLDKTIAFYEKATGYEVIERKAFANNPAANKLYDTDSLVFETAILKGPNMLLELTAFADQARTPIQKMMPQGPGMTHTCYQSPLTNPGFDKFIAAGATNWTRGDHPIDLGGVGVTYAYAHDPEGNMMELEQMSDLLISLQIGTDFADANPMWMTQVALITPNLPNLIRFYEKVLEIQPYRVGSYGPSEKADSVVNVDGLTFEGAWFMLDTQGKKLELMQYTNPVTGEPSSERDPTSLGYSFSFEVEDIQKEFQRLTNKGIEFISEPQRLGAFWTVFAFDPDGNLFSLRQTEDDQSILSLKNF